MSTENMEERWEWLAQEGFRTYIAGVLGPLTLLAMD